MAHRLNALGGLSLLRPDGSVAGGAVAQRRRLALYLRLALGGEAGVSRETLLDAFWPEVPGERARQSLSQALYVLRREVGSEDVVQGTATLRLDPKLLDSDVRQFLTAASERRWAEAIQSYQGPLLEGIYVPEADPFERWLSSERRRLEAAFAQALEEEARARSAAGEAAHAVELWRRRAALDPLSARVAVALMEALAAAGDVAAAHQHARVYGALVRAELDQEPDPVIDLALRRIADRIHIPRDLARTSPIGKLTESVESSEHTASNGRVPPAAQADARAPEASPAVAAPAIADRRPSVGRGRRRHTWTVAVAVVALAVLALAFGRRAAGPSGTGRTRLVIRASASAESGPGSLSPQLLATIRAQLADMPDLDLRRTGERLRVGDELLDIRLEESSGHRRLVLRSYGAPFGLLPRAGPAVVPVSGSLEEDAETAVSAWQSIRYGAESASDRLGTLIAVGEANTCVLLRSERVACWGRGRTGQLGDSTRRGIASPGPLVRGLTGVRDVGVGLDHACALTHDDAIWCWGANNQGQVGNPGSGETCRVEGDLYACSIIPLRAAPELTFQRLAVGYFFTCGLTADGVAHCWGYNLFGQLGGGTFKFSGTNATHVVAPVPFVAITAGEFHACALTAAGEAWCWGRNIAGELGDGTTDSSAVPRRVATPVRFVQLSAGSFYTCGITTDGAAHCWGRNAFGQLGDGTRERRLAPTLVHTPPGVRWRSIDTGTSGDGPTHTCALALDGRAFCWGGNGRGELGTGDQEDSNVPVPVTTGRFTQVVSATDYSCGLRASGGVFCWGNNTEGQAGTGLVTPTPVSRPHRVYFGPQIDPGG